MFAQYQIKNKLLRNIILIILFIILIPLICVLIDIIKTYGVIVGSIARYVIDTNMLP